MRRPATLLATCEEIAAQVELDHELPVELVVVGDAPLDDSAGALAGAVREAATNAAKHAGARARRDLRRGRAGRRSSPSFATPGVGFEPGAVPPDRRGVCDSIVGRVTRVGGSAEVETSSGGGTEWELRVPRSRT